MVSLSNHERLPLRQACPELVEGLRVSGDGTDLLHTNLRN